MITVPTVLILGAGASAPYGYPLGGALVANICDNLSDKDSNRFKIIQDQGFGWREIEEFREALFYSGKNSVDGFLEHRQEFIEIGKRAIAQELIKYEDPSQLFKKGDWYKYLYNLLNTTFEEFGENKLSIVTFNYDRSLEYYLFTSLKNSYGKSEDECATKMNSIPIIHVHGQIGPLPWQDDAGREYNNSLPRYKDIQISSERIRIIHEDVDIESDPEFKKARKVLEESKRIYFIGFGYHKENVNRLRIPPHKVMKGTCYELEEAEQVIVKKMFDPKMHKFSLAYPLTDALGFLRSEIVLD